MLGCAYRCMVQVLFRIHTFGWGTLHTVHSVGCRPRRLTTTAAATTTTTIAPIAAAATIATSTSKPHPRNPTTSRTSTPTIPTIPSYRHRARKVPLERRRRRRVHPIAGVAEGPVVVGVVEHGPGARGEVGRTHSHVPEKREEKRKRREEKSEEQRAFPHG